VCGSIANHAPRSTLITLAPWIGTLAAIVLALMPPGYWSWLRVVLVVVAVAHRRLGPTSSGPTVRATVRGRLQPLRAMVAR
jgi:hypothetical protein